MFDYTICNCADSKLFAKQCAALEKSIPGLQKGMTLEDVDGSVSQQYTHTKGSVVVKNDQLVDSLYILSEFDLSPYFE